MQQIFRNETCGDSSGVYRTDTLIQCVLFHMIFRQFWKLSCHQAVLFWMICGSCWIDISVLLTLWLDTISMTWILLRQCCQLFSQKTLSFQLITDSCCIIIFLLWQRPWWIQFVWYGFYSYTIGSFHLVRHSQWSPGPDWPLEHAWSIQLTSDWCPEGRPTHVLLASLEVTSPLCYFLFIHSSTRQHMFLSWIFHYIILACK